MAVPAPPHGIVAEEDERGAKPIRRKPLHLDVARTSGGPDSGLILDAVTTLLGDRRADEVTTRDIAAEAEVSSTVYRHFPDREALLEGLTQRLPQLDGVKPSFAAGGLDALAPTGVA